MGCPEGPVEQEAAADAEEEEEAEDPGKVRSRKKERR